MIILTDEDGGTVKLSGPARSPVKMVNKSGTALLKFSGVSGPKGEQGERGPQGEAGVVSTVDIPNFVLLFENKLI